MARVYAEWNLFGGILEDKACVLIALLTIVSVAGLAGLVNEKVSFPTLCACARF